MEQAVAEADPPSLNVSADEPTLRDTAWLSAQWERARLLAREQANTAILVIDEVQKVSGWPETVKWHWDEDTRRGIDLRVVLLGSAPLLSAVSDARPADMHALRRNRQLQNHVVIRILQERSP